jgi:hypothetical protein
MAIGGGFATPKGHTRNKKSLEIIGITIGTVVVSFITKLTSFR